MIDLGVGQMMRRAMAGEPQRANNLAHELEMKVFWGRCWEAGGAPAYWPWVQILRTAVASRDPDTLQRQLGSRAPFVAEVVGEVRDKLPDLLETVGEGYGVVGFDEQTATSAFDGFREASPPGLHDRDAVSQRLQQ